jgi:hypothetical protein
MAKSSGTLRLVIQPRAVRSRSLLPEVIDQLESLTRLMRALSDEDTALEVVSISKNSPLEATLRVVHRVRVRPSAAKKGAPKEKAKFKYNTVRTPITRLEKTLTAIKSKTALPTFADPYSLMQLKDFADDLNRADSDAMIYADGKEFFVDEALRQQIDSTLGATRIAYTSYVGTLERLNVHGSRWSFTIFPIAGPTRILCYFDQDDLEVIKRLVKKTVTVRGRAVYRGDIPWPLQIRVDSIEAREPAPENFWRDLPAHLERNWQEADDDDKGMMEAMVG